MTEAQRTLKEALFHHQDTTGDYPPAIYVSPDLHEQLVQDVESLGAGCGEAARRGMTFEGVPVLIIGPWIGKFAGTRVPAFFPPAGI